MASYIDFQNEWLTRRVGDPLLIGHGETEQTMYQCVSLVKQYMIEVAGIRVDWPGDAINFWDATNGTILTKFYKTPDRNPQAGDIAIFYGINGNKFGHIGISSGVVNGSQMQILEQNGQTGKGTGQGGDAIRLRWIDTSRLAGLLRLSWTPRPAPAPAVVTPPQEAPYILVETYFKPKLIRLNKQPTNLWGMNYRSFDYMRDHPVEVHDINEVHEVTNKVRHTVTGYEYYRRDGQVDGFNVADCDDYTPPAPYVPPAAPAPVPLAPKYQLTNDTYGFDNWKAAWNRSAARSTGKVPAGEYVIHEIESGMFNLTLKNGYAGQWINPALIYQEPVAVPDKIIDVIKTAAEQIPEPLPDPDPSPSWHVGTMVNNGQPVLYQAINVVPIKVLDLAGKAPPLTMQPLNKDENHRSHPVPIILTRSKDGIKYGFTAKVEKIIKDKGAGYYGIPMTYLQKMVDTAPVALDYNHDGKRDISDISDGLQGFIDYGSKLFKSTVHNLNTVDKVVQVRHRTVQFIDGLTRRKK